MWEKIGKAVRRILDRAKWIKWTVYALIATVIGWWLYSNQTKITRLEETVTYYSNRCGAVSSPGDVIIGTNTLPQVEVVRAYSIPPGMPKGGPDKQIDVMTKTNASTGPEIITVMLEAGSAGTRYRLPLGWDARCLVYAHEDDFDRLINIRGITNPQWIYRGPKAPPLSAGTRVTEFWLRNRDSRPIKVEFHLTPTPANN